MVDSMLLEWYMLSLYSVNALGSCASEANQISTNHSPENGYISVPLNIEKTCEIKINSNILS